MRARILSMSQQILSWEIDPAMNQFTHQNSYRLPREKLYW